MVNPPVSSTGRKINSFFYLAVLLFWAGSQMPAIADETGRNKVKSEVNIEQLLMRYAHHGHLQSYQGTFVYLYKDTAITFNVNRSLSEQGRMIEELFSQDGNEPVTYKVLENQYCYLDNNWLYQNKAISSSFPFRVNNNFEALKEYYQFQSLGNKKIAGIDTVGIKITPKDGLRYGYQLWFEPKSAMLLKFKLTDVHDNLIEQYFFTNIKYLNLAPARQSQIQSVTASVENEKLQPSCMDRYQPLNKAFNLYFSASKLPDGFRPVFYRHTEKNKQAASIIQFQFSDGLSAVSVFIEKAGSTDKNIKGIAKMGSMNVAGESFANHQVTVLGVIPVAGALKFLSAFREQ
jgi:sigma-E factor negative regulatory protein RseB